MTQRFAQICWWWSPRLVDIQWYQIPLQYIFGKSPTCTASTAAEQMPSVGRVPARGAWKLREREQVSWRRASQAITKCRMLEQQCWGDGLCAQVEEEESAGQWSFGKAEKGYGIYESGKRRKGWKKTFKKQKLQNHKKLLKKDGEVILGTRRLAATRSKCSAFIRFIIPRIHVKNFGWRHNLTGLTYVTGIRQVYFNNSKTIPYYFTLNESDWRHYFIFDVCDG